MRHSFFQVIGTSAFLLGAFDAQAQSRIVTWFHTDAGSTNTVEIAPFETVRVLYMREITRAPDITLFRITKLPGKEAILPFQASSTPWPVIAGPAVVSMETPKPSMAPPTREEPAVLTLEILPNAYPVTNSVAFGPGQGGRVALEKSTNLVEWIPTTNGLYTVDAATFFRLKVERTK